MKKPTLGEQVSLYLNHFYPYPAFHWTFRDDRKDQSVHIYLRGSAKDKVVDRVISKERLLEEDSSSLLKQIAREMIEKLATL